MPLKDVGIMQCIPGMIVVEPADAFAFEAILREAAAWQGNVYIRCLHKKAPSIYRQSGNFPFGKAAILRAGNDVASVASGMMVAEALVAAELLEKQNINARVVDMYTIKLLDKETVLDCAQDVGALVTAENHRTQSGLACEVANCTAAAFPCVLETMGADDVFGEVGSIEYLNAALKRKRRIL